MLCQFDQCHEVEPSKHASNKKYCQRCKCFRKIDAARRRQPARRVTCEYDACHTFEARIPSAKYCPDCGCYRPAKKKRERPQLEQQEELFEQPYEFKLHRISRLPDGTKIIIVNDTQFPFQDKATLECVEKFWDDLKPEIEVYNGDILDFYALSVFDQNPSRIGTLQDDFDVARSWLEERTSKNPDATRLWNDGNHEDRLRRWMWRHGKALSSLRALTIEDQLGLDKMGFRYLSYRSIIEILGFRIEHGYRASKSAAFPLNVARLMAIATGSSGLCGHTHRMNVYYWADSRGTHSYRENGCLCRLDLEYAPFPNWQHGFTYGVVHLNKLHLTTVPIYDDGFFAEGEFYPRL